MSYLVRLIVLLLGAIPVLAAIFIVVPQLLRPEIPNVAVNPGDIMSIEYSKQHLKKISFGLTQSIGAERTEVLIIDNNGQARGKFQSRFLREALTNAATLSPKRGMWHECSISHFSVERVIASNTPIALVFIFARLPGTSHPQRIRQNPARPGERAA